MKIGILGGTFNPIHNTHIAIAKAAKEQFSLDEIWVIPAGIPPHKQHEIQITNQQRIDMVKLAIKDIKGFSLDLREIQSDCISYSYITLSNLVEEYPENDFYFIMGSDSILYFKLWMKPEIISQKATILCALRATDDINQVKDEINSLNRIFDGDFFLIENLATNDASTTIRELASLNRCIDRFVDKKVASYIMEHKLYTKTYTFEDVDKMLRLMKDELKPGRYTHTVGVSHTAGQLAVKWGYPMYDAMIAGALHDCAKCISDEKRLDICAKQNIPVRPIEKKVPQLLHGKVGAFFAKDKYGIEDEDILHSITYHTTGCPNMSLLDKIIYIADYIEPGRDKAPNLANIRAMAYTDIDECLYMILRDTVEYLEEGANDKQTDELTVETYNYYKKQLRKE